MGKTEAVYHKQDALLTLSAKVEACFPLSELAEDLKPLFKGASAETDHVLVMDRTVFYAQSGGQPADAGTVRSISDNGSSSTTFTVKGVRKSPGDTILHLGTFDDNNGEPFAAGTEVQQSVDEATRTLHCKLHDGGHVVSLAVRRLASSIPNVTELKAQHYPGSSFVEFQGHIGGEHKEAIEKASNDMIAEDLPIEVRWWTPEELKEKCWSVPEGLRLPEGEELARAVDVVGAGAYACGGTHMRTTGQLGGIVIRKIARQKGISKISYALK